MADPKIRIETNKGLTGYTEVTISQEKGFLGTGTEYVRRIDQNTGKAIEKAVESAIVKGIIPKK